MVSAGWRQPSRTPPVNVPEVATGRVNWHQSQMTVLSNDGYVSLPHTGAHGRTGTIRIAGTGTFPD